MKKQRSQKAVQAETIAAEINPRDADLLGTCIVAALVWLALCAYLFFAVPVEFAQLGAVTANMPAAPRYVIQFYEAHGTAWAALAGIAGCCIAYARRNIHLANLMIAIGALAIALLLYELLTHKLPAAPDVPSRAVKSLSSSV